MSSDTKVMKSPWGEEFTMNEEDSRRFERLEDTVGKTYDLLREQADRFNQFRLDSTTVKGDHERRLALLESTTERRSAFKSGAIMAATGAFFGAVAAAIGRKTGFWMLLACIMFAGCALTPEETRTIANEVRQETHADGTPLTPAEIEERIKEKGAEKKKNKGWGIALTLLQVAIMVGSSLTKKAVL